MDYALPLASSTSGNLRVDAPTLPGNRLLLRMLDEMEYGMLLIDATWQLRYANVIGLDRLEDGAQMGLRGDRVVPASADRRPAFHEAVKGALRGFRHLLTFGTGLRTVSIAVTPMPETDDRGSEAQGRYALLVFSKQPETPSLSIHFFARSHGLTGAETVVLSLLGGGLDPADIAIQQRVALSTIRSQIASIRAKTHTTSIRELVDRLLMLPPIRPALRSAQRRSVDLRGRP